MADQVTTISALPAGYGTIAGLIYALTATPLSIRHNIAWVKMCQVVVHKPHQQAGGSHSSAIEEIRGALSTRITKEMRQFGLHQTNASLERDIAALHILSSFLQDNTQGEEIIGNRKPSQKHNEIMRSVLPIGKATTHSKITQTNDLHFSNDREGQTSLDVLIQFVEHTGTHKEADLRQISEKDFADSVASVKPSDEHGLSLQSMFQNLSFRTTRSVVMVQAAAPLEAMIIEVGYKAVELLFGCGIILGSTGGAWLGLTLSSLFPQRTAAGLYLSSYGQLVPAENDGDNTREAPYAWTPAGTVWTNGPESYRVLPREVLSDEWRNAVGYWIQYILFLLFQWFKLRVRNSLEFSPYIITRDIVRYILLVLVPFVHLICWIVIRREWKISKASARDILALVVYLIFLSAILVCLFLGQKAFVDTAHFYIVGKITNFVAAVCCVAMMSLNVEDQRLLSSPKWVLLWTVGACTVVW
jgi:hypothetical protein